MVVSAERRSSSEMPLMRPFACRLRNARLTSCRHSDTICKHRKMHIIEQTYLFVSITVHPLPAGLHTCNAEYNAGKFETGATRSSVRLLSTSDCDYKLLQMQVWRTCASACFCDATRWLSSSDMATTTASSGAMRTPPHDAIEVDARMEEQVSRPHAVQALHASSLACDPRLPCKHEHNASLWLC